MQMRQTNVHKCSTNQTNERKMKQSEGEHTQKKRQTINKFLNNQPQPGSHCAVRFYFNFLTRKTPKENLQLHTAPAGKMEMEKLRSDGKHFGHRKLIIIYDYKASWPPLCRRNVYVRIGVHRVCSPENKTKGRKVSWRYSNSSMLERYNGK